MVMVVGCASLRFASATADFSAPLHLLYLQAKVESMDAAEVATPSLARVSPLVLCPLPLSSWNPPLWLGDCAPQLNADAKDAMDVDDFEGAERLFTKVGTAGDLPVFCMCVCALGDLV
jgi:hypothetical protein